jgi:hypothetical protein
VQVAQEAGSIVYISKGRTTELRNKHIRRGHDINLPSSTYDFSYLRLQSQSITMQDVESAMEKGQAGLVKDDASSGPTSPTCSRESTKVSLQQKARNSMLSASSIEKYHSRQT